MTAVGWMAVLVCSFPNSQDLWVWTHLETGVFADVIKLGILRHDHLEFSVWVLNPIKSVLIRDIERRDTKGEEKAMWRWQSILESCFQSFSHVQLFCDPMDQTPLSMGFPRQEYWSGLPFPFPEDLPDPGIEPSSPALQVDSLLLSHQVSPRYWDYPATNLGMPELLEDGRGKERYPLGQARAFWYFDQGTYFTASGPCLWNSVLVPLSPLSWNSWFDRLAKWLFEDLVIPVRYHSY